MPRGSVDPQSPPIAGLGGVAKSEGLTTQTIYDRCLTDGVGLDSTGGVAVEKLGGGTYNVNITAVLAKLAQAPTSGGAGVSFGAWTDGSATLSINPQEELAVSIQDGLGHTVCTARIESYFGTTPNALVTWNCTRYDNVVALSGFGDVVETIGVDAAAGQTKTHTDGAGRALKTIDALAKVSTAKYDAGSAVVESRDPNSVGYNAVFDALGRETSRTDTHGEVVSTTYDRAGNVKTVTDAKSHTTTSSYDARGRLASRTNRLSGGTIWTYDANGNLLTLQDAETQITSYEYDVRNLKTKETYPDHVSGSGVGTAGYGIVEFTYDPARRLQRKTDQLGDTVTYMFDKAGRLTQRDYRTRANSPSGTISDSDVFTYDLASRVLSATSGRYSNTVTQTYDVIGRLKTEALAYAGQTYTVARDFDSVSRLSRLTYPDGSLVDRTYTVRGQLYQVKYNSGVINTRAYDNGGRLSTSTYGNGVVATHTYRNDNLTQSIEIRKDSNVLDSFAYSYDANKNKTAETRTGVMAPWGWSTGASGYDVEDRLTAWNRTDQNLSQSWNLTLEGDWQQFTENTTVQSRTHGPAHELNAIDATGLTYDPKGNLTLNVTGHRYFWDFDNQLQGVDITGDQVADVTFGYDALGRRVKKTASGATRVYVSKTEPIAYSPYAGQEIAEYVSGTAPSSPTEKYIYGDYIDEPIWKTGTGGTVYYHANNLYCVSALTSTSGAVVERYRYTPYGVLTILAPDGVTVRTSSSYANPYTYTGRRWDPEVSLYYYRARCFSAQLGRFLSRDPVKHRAGDLHLLQYAGGSPMDAMDPSGLKLCKCLCECRAWVLAPPAGGGKEWTETQWTVTQSQTACSAACAGLNYRVDDVDSGRSRRCSPATPDANDTLIVGLCSGSKDTKACEEYVISILKGKMWADRAAIGTKWRPSVRGWLEEHGIGTYGGRCHYWMGQFTERVGVPPEQVRQCIDGPNVMIIPLDPSKSKQGWKQHHIAYFINKCTRKCVVLDDGFWGTCGSVYDPCNVDPPLMSEEGKLIWESIRSNCGCSTR